MLHFHSAEEVDGSGQFSVGLLQSSAPAIQSAKSEVAVGLERCHPEFFRPGYGLSVSGLGRLGGGRVLLCMDLAEKPQAPCLMAPFLVGAGEVDGLSREVHGLIPAASQQIGFTQPGQPARQGSSEVDGRRPLNSLFQQGHGLAYPTVQGMRRGQRRG
jgi:hypothetical protein